MSSDLIKACPPAKNALAGYFVENVHRIQSVCSSSLDFKRFVASCIIALNDLKSTENLNQGSALIAALNCAHIGLMPSKQTGHCFFIPRKGRLNLEIGYKGYIHLAVTSGYLSVVHAEVILRGEHFEHYVDEDGPKLRHDVPLDRDLRSASVRENYVGAYCVFRTRDDKRGMRVLPKERIAKVDSGRDVWKDDPYSMIRKTPIRRAASDWVLSEGLKAALELDTMTDRDEVQGLVESLRQERLLSENAGTKSFSLDDLPVVTESDVIQAAEDPDAVF